MPTRDERRAEAAKHIALMKGAFGAEIEACVASAEICEDGDALSLELPEPSAEATDTRVTTDFAPAAAYAGTGRVAVVDPASFTRPGGSYEDGAFGPEQILCSESALYPVLCGMRKAYYEGNRGYSSGQLFTSRALYLTDVPFVRNGNIRKIDMIAVAEPNRARALENHRSERECDECLAERIRTALNLAAAHGVDTLVVGAYGCGPQGAPAQLSIDAFKAWIGEHPGAIAHIVFAVPRAYFAAFDEAFGAPKAEAAPAPATETPARDDAGDDDDFDVHAVELPEGITLR